MMRRNVALAVTIFLALALSSQHVFAATGAPRILNYQGRLMDATGNVLGGSGTNYCFRFSLYDSSVAGSGTKLWPATTPSTMTISVKNGVFNAGVGDTGAGGDTLDYNFQDSDTVYLNVDVATMVGPTCAPGDGAEVYESLSPRQRLYSSAYTVNANTVGGFAPSQNASGNQIPVLASGNLILGGTDPILSATTTNALTIQGNSTGDIRFFNANNRLNSSGNLSLGGSLFLANGAATSTLQSALTGTSTLQGFLNVLGANSTSTFSGGLSVSGFDVSGAATSTFSNGLSLASGCFAVNGVCISTGFATSSADFYANASTTLVKTYTSNSFTATQTFINASTTNFSATYASSTQGFFGSLFVGSLNGILRATAGAVATSLVNLASDVTGFLGVVNGGTGTSTAPTKGQVLLGNALGGYDLVATSSLGISGGVADGTFSTTSADYYVNASTTIPKTYASNVFSALQQFGNASTTLLSVANGISTTTILGHATSTFGAGIQATSLALVGVATSSLAGGINLSSGCYSQNGTCIGAGSTVVLSAVRTGTATTTWSVPTGLVYAVVELWGGGGGGGGGGSTGLTGGTGASSNFGGLATSTGGVGGGGGGAVRAGGLGGNGLGGSINLPGMPGQGGGVVTVSGAGGSATRGGDGGAGVASAITAGNNGDVYGGGGSGGGNTTATRTGAGGGGAGFIQRSFTSADLTGTTSVQVAVGLGGAAGVGGGTGPSAGGSGGAGGYIIYEYTASNVSTGNGSVNNGTAGQVAFYNANGSSVSGTSLLYADTVNGRIGISSTTPAAELSVVGSAIVTGHIITTDITATGTLSVSGQTTLGNASTTNFSAVYASSTQGFFGFLSLGSITGILKATAGAISNSLVNLTSDVTGFLGVTNGGTGTSTAPTQGQVLVGNALGGYDLMATSTFADGKFSTTSADYYANGSTTIAKTYAANSFTATQTFANASTTNISASYASSTLGFFGSLSLGSISGILKATAGAVSNSLVNLASDVSGVLGVGSGGTGWASLAANTLLTGNGSGQVATTTVATSLQISGGTLSLNVGNANVWTGLQSFANASTSIESVFTKAYFGGTATTTIDSAGNVVVAGTLSVTGNTTLSNATTTNLLVTASSSINKLSTAQATSTALNVTSTFTGAGLSACGNTTDKLLWSSTTGQFSCGVDAGAGTGISNLGPAGQQQSGASQTFATSTDANLGFTITSAANVHTFTTVWNGVLSVIRGGTGWASLAAGTLLTGNGSGAVATTTVTGGLKLSGTQLTLDLAAANVWSGLQTFGNASTTFLESETQFARTIQSTSTNALVFKTNLTSTAGLTLGGTTTTMVALDTQNNRINLGTGGSSNPTILVADTGNAADPTGVNGAMYYSSTFGTFRCFENSAWRSCGGQAASSTGDVQIKNVDGSYTATDNFNWSLANNGLTITGNPGQVGDLFAIASSTGAVMFDISSAGVLKLATTTEPATPTSGLDIYAKQIAGRGFLAVKDSNGAATSLQPFFARNKIGYWNPQGNAATVPGVFGFTAPTVVSNGGTTYTARTVAVTNVATRMRRLGLTTTATAGTMASQYITVGQYTVGDGAGNGGFTLIARFIPSDAATTTGERFFMGMSSTVAAPTNIEPSTMTNSIGVAQLSTGTDCFIVYGGSVAQTPIDLGSNFNCGLAGSKDAFEIALFAPNESNNIVYYEVTRLSDGFSTSGKLTGTAGTVLPSSSTLLAYRAFKTNNATALAAAFDVASIYLETDN